MPATYRKLFKHEELEKILGERVLSAHNISADGASYRIDMMVIVSAKDKRISIRAEVTPLESQHAEP